MCFAHFELHTGTEFGLISSPFVFVLVYRVGLSREKVHFHTLMSLEFSRVQQGVLEF